MDELQGKLQPEELSGGITSMEVETALEHADEWTKGQTFYPGQEGWRVVCAVLAAEVRRLRQEVSK